MTKKVFYVKSDIEPIRLDIYLVHQGLGISRSQIQKGIREKWIRVEGKGTKPAFILRGGEHIVVELPEEEPLRLVPEDIPLDIIYEDEHLVVVNKPAGMVVHPARGWWSGTLVHGLLYHINELSSVGGKTRPGIIHRLDKNTSGLLIVAKNTKAHHRLAKALSLRKIRRFYFTLVWGTMDKEGIIDAPMGRNPVEHKKMAVVEEGKSARTIYHRVKDFKFISSLKVELKTGRTHQIRVHMYHIGHPVFGDPDYSGREQWLMNIPEQYRQKASRLLELIDRQALHAQELHFAHPITGEEMHFTARLPEDINEVIKELKSPFTD